MIMGIFGMTSCSSASAADGYTDMNVAQFDSYIKEPGVQLVDVRTAQEYAEGHIAGAINIDYYDRNFVGECEAQLDKAKPVAVYCRSGHRSGLAAKALAKAGFKVTNLEGGIMAWNRAGMPTTR